MQDGREQLNTINYSENHKIKEVTWDYNTDYN